MLDELEAAVDNLALSLDDTELIHFLRVRERLDAMYLQRLVDYDDAALWEAAGATSLTAWLRHPGGLTTRAAVTAARTVKRLAQLPALAAAAAEGALTGGQVETILGNLTRTTLPLFADVEAHVVPLLAHCDLAGTTEFMREWRARAEATADGDPPDADEQALHLSRTYRDRHVVNGTLNAKTGDLLDTALRLANSGDTDTTPARRRADALGDICRFFLDHHTRPATRRNRPHITLIRRPGTDHGHDAHGHRHGSAYMNQLLCDCIAQTVSIDDHGNITHYDRGARTIPVHLFHAVAARDQHCRFPGCDRPVSWCEAHHVQPWQHGGPTAAANLVLLCSRHHHLIHRTGWRTELRADGGLVVTHPDGRIQTTYPPGTRRPTLP
jgi:hypothetical protein